MIVLLLSFILARESLFLAIEQVESRGDPQAVNINEGAVGPFQIRMIFLRDVNRILGRKEFASEDRYDRHRCRQMITIYLYHYATERRLARRPTFEDYVRILNGGPNGYKKESTKAHWQKVKVWMKK